MRWQGILYSTNPDFEYEYEKSNQQTLPPLEQDLKVCIDKHRAGKTAVIIKGFIGENDDLKILSKKPNSVTNTEWEKYLICCNLSKTAISREFPDFLEPGIWKSGNSGIHQKCPKLTYK